ncbi:MAG: type II toxin-antitoxin system prevent-host-death family antitoxin [Gemmatimonadetes bacterium]|nr:type II toxin-antitoxin system prevent-host-death family antitoxin [Gemmatimonadota bacterium]
MRDLRHKGGRILERVARGESLTVTLDGSPIAELHPVAPRGLPAETLLERWRGLPPVDARTLRRDIDRALDTSL